MATERRVSVEEMEEKTARLKDEEKAAKKALQSGERLDEDTRNIVSDLAIDRTPREPDAAFLAGEYTPKVALTKPWVQQPFPSGWDATKTSHKARLDAMQKWPDRLRVLLPDSNAAPSAARREALWQRMAITNGLDDQLPVDAVIEELERLLEHEGLVERQKFEAKSRPVLFLTAALRAAAEETESLADGMIERRTFRLLLMRMHQYLDVYTVLAEVVPEPHNKVKREHFERLLKERRHTMALKPNGPEVAAYKIFEKIGLPGEPDVAFDRIARWSMRQQYVRPGSGAAVTQTRLLDHQMDPGSIGLHGTYQSVRARKPQRERGQQYKRSESPEVSARQRSESPGDDNTSDGAGASTGRRVILGGRMTSLGPPKHHKPRARPKVPLGTPRARTPRASELRPSMPPAVADSENSSEAGDTSTAAAGSGAAAAAAAKKVKMAAIAPAEAPTPAEVEAERIIKERAERIERAAMKAARAAARRVASAKGGNPLLASRAAGTTLVSAASEAAAASPRKPDGSPRFSSDGVEQLVKRAMLRGSAGDPTRDLVVRFHTGRVVPAWFATPSAYSMAFEEYVSGKRPLPPTAAGGGEINVPEEDDLCEDAKAREADAKALALFDEEDAKAEEHQEAMMAKARPPSAHRPRTPAGPRGTMMSLGRRGTPSGMAPPSSRHLSVGWGEWGHAVTPGVKPGERPSPRESLASARRRLARRPASARVGGMVAFVA